MITEKLPVKLTEDEITQKGRDLADTEAKISEAKEKKKSVARAHQDAIDEIQEKINELSKQINSGEERREVEVVEHEDYATGTIFTRRTDTGATVRSRPMPVDMQQLDLERRGSKGSPKLLVNG